MATVHRATDIRSDRAVAVKLLRAEVSRDTDLAQRFRREALAATVLRHPNIVACLDAGTDGQQPYLVMELIEGEDLAARLKRGGRLAPWQAARIALDVARALGVAHIRGIVHRDVKPGNILLASDGRAMVTDFGIARLAADAEAALPGTTLGSVHYFSPEQARGATTTPASDVYGLGLVLYEALTGQRAWTGESTDAIAIARIGADAPSPRALRAEVPTALDEVVRRALAPEAVDRFVHGNAMAAALEPIVAAGDEASPTAVVVLPPPPPPSTAAVGAAPSPGSGGHAGREDAHRSGNGARPRPGPSGARRGASRAARSRRGPATALGAASRLPVGGVAVVLVALIALAGGAAFVAALPGRDPSAGNGASPAGQAAVTRSPRPTPSPTPEPTARPTPTPKPTAPPSPKPSAVPAGEVADLCEVFFDIPCGLGAGRYAPSRFAMPFDIELGDGWSNADHRGDIVTLTREQGRLTFAGPIREVYPKGESVEPKAKARSLIEAFIATDGVGSSKPANVRIDGRRGLSIDVAPTGNERVALFRTDGSTYQLEPDRTTRVVVIDLPHDPIVLAIEPHDGFELRDILDTADGAAGTIRWR
jgi:serine/threonine-protein kinase